MQRRRYTTAAQERDSQAKDVSAQERFNNQPVVEGRAPSGKSGALGFGGAGRLSPTVFGDRFWTALTAPLFRPMNAHLEIDTC